MNKIRLAINGFGRIGRLACRRLLQMPEIQIVAINDLAPAASLAHLFQYDSSQGTYQGSVQLEEDQLLIDGQKIQILAERDPKALPWKSLEIDMVLECTGIFRTREKALQHVQAGAKKVLLSAPAKSEGIPTIVQGINQNEVISNQLIYSNASCTTNCLAPILKIFNESWGIEHAIMETVHAYTADQNLQDAPHSDLRRARAAALNIVPTSTGAANAVQLVLPELKGKISAAAMRVPVPTGSLIDLTILPKNSASIEEINAVYKAAAQGDFKGILAYSEAPLVSSDIVGNPHSCIFDAPLTSQQGPLVRLVAWYDNESGYANRLAETALFLAKKS
ncbi:type I glyceraldehyde-3-phosphate dehydrogenase [Saprospira grandis]|uniref:type I glyceraldehyde-3-phosphate dehydrogenase n=1 Tax=Saprospira grandis TaxID=1008 RepID=UPI0022DE5BAE|nr:type I glyceraldehyde-3-phosphate dehydrogenase [Saprospira grandis]WBM74453.1 type I glyceraldehyde-3-phosphate dehydrogenase [Saprospira grandis]